MIDIQKSFCLVGESQPLCFNCKYCRAKSEEKISSLTIPSTINPIFTNIPVAVNLYYGDAFLQKESTFNILNELQKAHHKGPVVVVTKGNIDIEWLKDDTFKNLDLHIALSTFGIKHEYDLHSHEQFLKNLEIDIPHKKSIEFRPICYNINDSQYVIENVFSLAKKYGLSIGYSGLQGKPESVEYWVKNNINLQPYPGYRFGHKKSISDGVQEIFNELSKSYEVNIFKKTSCLISSVHNLERDYNAHYYRPSEMGCKECVMKDKCFSFKENLSLDKSKINIPFKFDIVKKENHECILKTKNICEFPTDDCSRISGNIIKIQQKLTTADVRLIKWLTGYTVDADFVESSLISKNWLLDI